MPTENAPPHPDVNPWIIAIAVMCATFMEILDTTVVNVSLPHIAGSMSATVEESTWALTSYLVANAIVLPITGWLGNYFGRKRLLMFAVIGFTTSSVLCGLAPNLMSLIVFRILQGASGGALQPLSQAVMLEAFPPEDRGKAMAFWGFGVVVAPMLGPVLGGWITDNYSWRWVFYINLPVGVASIILTKMFIFDPPYIRRPKTGIDFWGMGMLALAIASLQVVLDKGNEDDWFASHLILILTVVAAFALVLFVAWELIVPHPVVQLRVFKSRSYSNGVLLMTIVGFVLYSSLVLLPIFLQQLLGYPAVKAGIAMFPRGLGSFIMMPITGVLLSRFDPRKLLGLGVLGAAYSMWQLSSINLNAGYWDIFWPQFLQGLSLSLLFVPLTTVTMAPIAKEAMGNATSLFNLLRNLGGSVGIAFGATYLARRQQIHQSVLAANVTPMNPNAQAVIGAIAGAMQQAGGDASQSLQRAYGVVQGMIVRQASMLSFLDTFRLMAIIFLLVLPLLLLFKRPAAKSRNDVAASH
jgi:MFS transporter, DHA2 family, multidrug resistance protein